MSQETLAVLVTCALLWAVAFWCDWRHVLRPRKRAAAPTSAPAAVPFLITVAMRARLQALGLVDAEIDKMTPEAAWKLLDELDPQPGDHGARPAEPVPAEPAHVEPAPPPFDLDAHIMCPIVREEMKRFRASGAILVPQFRYLTFGGPASRAGWQPAQHLCVNWPTVVYARSATGPRDRFRARVGTAAAWQEHWDSTPTTHGDPSLPLASLFWGTGERPAVIALGKFLDVGYRVDVDVETLDDGMEVSLGFWCIEERQPCG